MSIQSEDNETKGRDIQQSTRDGTSSADSVDIRDTNDIGAVEESAVGKGNNQLGQQASRQGAMPPNQTDDDQYDQGTVQREP